MRREDWHSERYRIKDGREDCLRYIEAWEELGGIPVVTCRTGNASLFNFTLAGNPEAEVEHYIEIGLRDDLLPGGGYAMAAATVLRYAGRGKQAGAFCISIHCSYGTVRIDPAAHPGRDERIAALRAAAQPLVEAALADEGLVERWTRAAAQAAEIEATQPIWYKDRAAYEAACRTYGVEPLEDAVLATQHFVGQDEAPRESYARLASALHSRRESFLHYVMPCDEKPWIPKRPDALGKVGSYTVEQTMGHRAFQNALTAAVQEAIAHLPLPEEPAWQQRSLRAVIAEVAPDFAYGPDTLPHLLACMAGVRGRTVDHCIHWTSVWDADRRALADLLAWLDRLDPYWEGRSGDYGGTVVNIHDRGVAAPDGAAALFQTNSFWGGPPAPVSVGAEHLFRRTADALGLAQEPVLLGDVRRVLATAVTIACQGGYGGDLVVLDRSGILWTSGGRDHPALTARPFVREHGGLPRHPTIALEVAQAAWAWAEGGEPPPNPAFPAPPEAISGHRYTPVGRGDEIVRDRHRYRVTKARLYTDPEDFSYFADPLADRVWVYEAELIPASAAA